MLELESIKEKKLIRETLNRMGESFSRLDIASWLACFYLPRIIVMPQGAIAPMSEKECYEKLGPYIDKLRSLGFTKTTLDECNIQFLTGTTAMVGTCWTRYAQEKVLEKLGSTYLFSKTGEQWLASMVTVHPENVKVIQHDL